MNRLDNLPNDILYQILSFCGDHIQMDFKKNVISSEEFQNELKLFYLFGEYEVDDKQLERALAEYLFTVHPVSSFTLTQQYFEDSFRVEINYRKIVDNSYINVNSLSLFEVKEYDELYDEIEFNIKNRNLILEIDSEVIYNNLFEHQKNELNIEDIEDLIEKKCVSVLKAICDIDNLLEDVILNIDDDEIARLLNLDVCVRVNEFCVIERVWL